MLSKGTKFKFYQAIIVIQKRFANEFLALKTISVPDPDPSNSSGSVINFWILADPNQCFLVVSGLCFLSRITYRNLLKVVSSKN